MVRRWRSLVRASWHISSVASQKGGLSESASYRTSTYGSVFLRKLNRDWLVAWNDGTSPLYADTFCFSIGGTDHSFWQNHLTWQSRESVPMAPCEYRVRTSTTAGFPSLVESSAYDLTTLNQQAPHLIVETPAKRRFPHQSRRSGHAEPCPHPGVADDVSEIVHGFGHWQTRPAFVKDVRHR